MPEEDEISLVVEGDNSAPMKVWLLGDDGGEKSANGVAESCIEIVENHLRLVACQLTSVLRRQGN